MPRTYSRKDSQCTGRIDFSTENIERAVQRILNGEAAFKVAKATGIPRTTLRRKVE